MFTYRRLTQVVAASASALLLASACSSGVPDAKATSDAGQWPENSKVKKASDLKIAYFIGSKATAYLAVSAKVAQETAEKAGASLTVIDGQFDPQTQNNQIESALTSGKYNAFVIGAVDPQLECTIASKTAPTKGIPVAVLNQPLCGKSLEEGDAAWSPGTTTTVVTQSTTAYKDWVDQMAAEHANGAEVAAIMGQPTLAISKMFDTALASATAANPKIKVVAKQNTDWSTAQANAAVETILRANPNVSVIMTAYSPMSRAVVAAVKAAGRQDKIDVYDIGGDQWSLDAVKSGELASTMVLRAADESRLAVESLLQLADGKEFPKYIDLTHYEGLPNGSAMITSKTTDPYTAQY